MGMHEPIQIVMSQHANRRFQYHQRNWQGAIKSVFDKVVAGSALIVLSPLLAGAALAIKLDSKGPVIYKQSRHGLNNEVFEIWKFRTMNVMETSDNFRQAKKNDSRITRLGKFLRRSSIDELPQLINVLKGEMSLVGPRPHPKALNEKFSSIILRYSDRHLVKPGLTGWAQIRGLRGPTDTDDKMRKRIEHDLDYIDNWSLWLDFKILIATPFSLFLGKNAF